MIYLKDFFNSKNKNLKIICFNEYQVNKMAESAKKDFGIDYFGDKKDEIIKKTFDEESTTRYIAFHNNGKWDYEWKVNNCFYFNNIVFTKEDILTNEEREELKYAIEQVEDRPNIIAINRIFKSYFGIVNGILWECICIYVYTSPYEHLGEILHYNTIIIDKFEADTKYKKMIFGKRYKMEELYL